MALLWSGRDNEEVLNDPKVPSEFKDKIRLVEKYKSYFYSYWDKKSTGIYSETTLLDQEAVTYLVIASPYDHISPLKHSFPIMGSFPYLGFFSHEKAKKYAQKLRKENWITYIRPVYAYSTLGYFEDNILSSFFHYDNFSLAELVFHELFHTIFFIKNEVALNESLATFFSRKMTYDYFHLSSVEVEAKLKNYQNRDILLRKMVDHIHTLNQHYKSSSLKGKLTKEQAETLLQKYLSDEFLKDFEHACAVDKINNCFPVKRKWSNASLAALMTYQNKEKKLEELFVDKRLSLKKFFHFIQTSYDHYLDSDSDNDEPFSDTLFP